jgi:hypothetical protein
VKRRWGLWGERGRGQKWEGEMMLKHLKKNCVGLKGSYSSDRYDEVLSSSEYILTFKISLKQIDAKS